MAESSTGTHNTGDIRSLLTAVWGAAYSIPQSLCEGIPSPGNEVAPTLPNSIEEGHFLRYETNRLQTFRNFPPSTNVLPKDFASAGFFYTGTADRVKCSFCFGILSGLDIRDKPHIAHKNKFPSCRFVQGFDVGNVPMTPVGPAQGVNISENLNNATLSYMEGPGTRLDHPKYAIYAEIGKRSTSFKTWSQYKPQTPQQLADAGFYYAGISDRVTCFYCGGTLQNWEPCDEPWTEHARWFPRCSFLHTVKGEEFIRRVQERFNGSQFTSGNESNIRIGSTRPEEDEQDEVDEYRVQQLLTAVLTNLKRLDEELSEGTHLTTEEKIRLIRESQQDIGVAKSVLQNADILRRGAMESALSNLYQLETRIKAMR